MGSLWDWSTWDWGDVPTWIAAVIASFSLGTVAIGRWREIVRGPATSVVVWGIKTQEPFMTLSTSTTEEVSPDVTVTETSTEVLEFQTYIEVFVHNLSDSPILLPTVATRLHRWPWARLADYGKQEEFKPQTERTLRYLEPGQMTSSRVDPDTDSNALAVVFSDRNRRRWAVNVAGGRLRRVWGGRMEMSFAWQPSDDVPG